MLNYLLELKDSFWNRQAVFKAKSILQYKQDKKNEEYRSKHKDNKNLYIRELLEYEYFLIQLKKALIQLSELQKKMWNELLLPQSNLNKIYKFNTEIFFHIKSINEKWEIAFSSNYADLKTMVIYKLYMTCIRGIAESWNEKGKFKINNEALFNENNSHVFVILGVDSSKGNLGKITRVSSGISKIFEYSQSDVIGTNISILMPSFVGKVHYEFIDSYLNSGEGRILNKDVNIFAVNKENYLFGIHVVVREYYTIQQDICFLAIIRRAMENKGIILTDPNGIILNISYDLYLNMKELNSILISEQNISLFYICPNLNKQLNDGPYDEFEGNATITFCAPKNLQIVSSLLQSKNAMNKNFDLLHSTLAL